MIKTYLKSPRLRAHVAARKCSLSRKIFSSLLGFARRRLVACSSRKRDAERKRAIGATGTYVRCTLRRLERNDKAGEKHILRERSRGHRQPRRSRRRQFHLLEHAFKLKAKTTMIFTVERVKEESG